MLMGGVVSRPPPKPVSPPPPNPPKPRPPNPAASADVPSDKIAASAVSASGRRARNATRSIDESALDASLLSGLFERMACLLLLKLPARFLHPGRPKAGPHAPPSPPALVLHGDET